MLFYVTALAVVIADLVTKEIAHRALLTMPGGRVPVIPGLLDFNLQFNSGAAFSLLRDYPAIITVFSLIAIAAIFLWGRTIPREIVSARIALGLFLGGGIGNLVDRVRLGAVVDFIHFYYKDWYFPTFNIADCAITVGITIFLFLLLFTNKLDDRRHSEIAESAVEPDPHARELVSTEGQKS